MLHNAVPIDLVEASVNFLRPMDGRPVSYRCEPPPGVPVTTGKYDPHRVTISDGRPLAIDLSLDVQGFASLDAPTAFSVFGDEHAIRSVYYAEVEEMIQSVTGAALVITFDHNIRSAARAAAGDPGIRGPVLYAHADFTARSGRDRVRRVLEGRGLDVGALLERRFGIVNLWRPIGRPVDKFPLAMCDASTVGPNDLVASDLVYRDRVGENYALSFNQDQLWYYFPRLAPDEAILFKGYDSSEEVVARFTAHSAFEDPTTPPDAPERESIEARALAIYA